MQRKTELLIPAGTYEIAKIALYSGADAVYLATSKFGARAYAQNLSMEELVDIVKISYVLHKKVYVTVNTIIKEQELEEVKDYLKQLYSIGVFGVIVADIAIYNYVLENLKDMECHISTQVGVKDLEDVKFFENLGVKRVVLAREDSFEEIEYIRKNTNVDLEVFIHGALCVSYSGGCLFSSLLSLRSGNRGRCSQNCRREYIIYEDGKPITNKGFYLSMKDLHSGIDVKKLAKIGVDSLKVEGRMKNSSYVALVTKYYRDILDNGFANDKIINQVFHRKYTKGFLFGEDRGSIANVSDPGNEGRKIGEVIDVKYDYVLIKAFDKINIGDRLRFSGNFDQYITVKEINYENKMVKIPLDFKLFNHGLVYKMLDSEINMSEVKSNLVPVSLYVSGSKGNKLEVTFVYENNYYTAYSDILEPAINKPTSKDTILKQISKLTDTPFYIDSFVINIEEDFYISVGSINCLRRKLVDEIYQSVLPKRIINNEKELIISSFQLDNNKLIAFCETEAQANACKKMGIDVIFYENYSPYVNAKYSKIEKNYLLVASYGGLNKYKDKNITTDYSFNVINSEAIFYLLKYGAKNITLSYELSGAEIKMVSNSFKEKFGFKPPLDLIVYGRQPLMTLKYCPLKALGKCGICHKHNYMLKDEGGTFPLISKDCYTKVLNGKKLNLLDQMQGLLPYVNRFRLQFSLENEAEVIDIINKAKNAISTQGEAISKEETRGYFKRPIL